MNLIDVRRETPISIFLQYFLQYFQAMVRWINFNRTARQQLAPHLLRLIRLYLIPAKDLVDHVETVDFIVNIRECFLQLYSAMSFHALKNSNSYETLRSYQVQHPRGQSLQTEPMVEWNSDHGPASCIREKFSRPFQNSCEKSAAETLNEPQIYTTSYQTFVKAGGTENTIEGNQRMHNISSNRSSCLVVAVGGIELESANPDVPGRCVFGYNMDSSGWSRIASLPQYTHHHGVASVNGHMYVVGGAVYDPNFPDRLGSATRATYKYDPTTNVWNKVASMLQARAYMALTTVAGKLYAVGGEDENRRKLDSIECYNPEKNEWVYTTSMPSGGRVGASCASLGGRLYVVGGYNRDRGPTPVMDDVDCFDTYLFKWIQKNKLPQPRCHANLVEALGDLYLIGGRTKVPGQPISSMASILKYTSSEDTWKHLTNMCTPRHDAGCTVFGDTIYIIGGIQSPSPSCLSSVECWDCHLKTWRRPTNSLPYTAAGLACCVLPQTKLL